MFDNSNFTSLLVFCVVTSMHNMRNNSISDAPNSEKSAVCMN